MYKCISTRITYKTVNHEWRVHNTHQLFERVLTVANTWWENKTHSLHGICKLPSYFWWRPGSWTREDEKLSKNKSLVWFYILKMPQQKLISYSILPFFQLHYCVDSLTVFRDPLFPFEHSFLVHGCQWSFLQTWSKNNRLNDCIYIILRIP